VRVVRAHFTNGGPFLVPLFSYAFLCALFFIVEFAFARTGHWAMKHSAYSLRILVLFYARVIAQSEGKSVANNF
jgi:hypothetical protein